MSDQAARLADYGEFVYELRRKSMRHTSGSMHAYDFECGCDLCEALPTIREMAAELVRVSREAEQLRKALNAALSNDFEWWKTAANALEEGDRQT